MGDERDEGPPQLVLVAQLPDLTGLGLEETGVFQRYRGHVDKPLELRLFCFRELAVGRQTHGQ